jgi:hypothetical protein
LSIDEISAQKEVTDDELFEGKPSAAPINAKLVYQGGALIQNVEVFTIFWGMKWAGSASGQALMAKLNAFFKAILVSPLLDQLAEYNTGPWKIGHGKYTGTKVITANAPTVRVSDAQIQAELNGWIAANLIPKPNANTLYFIYTDPRVSVQMGGSASCSSFCGYHENINKQIFYAVMPFPSCSGCLGGKAVLDALTGTSSHELCEAITDPVPGDGWYDSNNGEIGDICAWHFKQVAGYNVQLEWSNARGKCV